MRSKIGPVPNTFFQQVTVLIGIINTIYQGNNILLLSWKAASGEIPEKYWSDPENFRYTPVEKQCKERLRRKLL